MPIHVFLGKKNKKKYIYCVYAHAYSWRGSNPRCLFFYIENLLILFFLSTIVVHCTYTLAVKLLLLECFPYFPLFVLITYAHKTHALPTELCCFLRNLLLETDFLNGITMLLYTYTRVIYLYGKSRIAEQRKESSCLWICYKISKFLVYVSIPNFYWN